MCSCVWLVCFDVSTTIRLYGGAAGYVSESRATSSPPEILVIYIYIYIAVTFTKKNPSSNDLARSQQRAILSEARLGVMHPLFGMGDGGELAVDLF